MPPAHAAALRSPAGRLWPLPGRLLAVGLLALVTAAVTLSTGAARADAYVIAGEPWPGKTISYYNTVPQYRDVVRTAAWVWELSGVRVRFVPAPSRRSADFVITRYPGYTGCSGLATAGRQRYRAAFVRLASSTCAETAVHEFGHVLGLDHSDRLCSLMYNGSRRPRGPGCERVSFTDPNRLCRLLKADDIAGAVRLYGRASRPQRNCAPWPALEPVGLSLTADPSGGLELRGRFPTVPLATPWARTLHRLTSGVYPRVDIATDYDRCPPANPPGRSGIRWDALADRYGTPFRKPVPAGEGATVCATIVTVDSIGQSRMTQHIFPVPLATG